MMPVHLYIAYSEKELAMRAKTNVVISKLQKTCAGCQFSAAFLAYIT